MTPGPLHALFERLFGGTDDPAKDSAHARQAAHLAADLDRGESDTLDVAQLAAYLDGGLDEAAQQDIHAHLSQSPAAFHEAASADAFLEALAAAQETAPADLVASTIAMSRPAAVSPSSPRRSFPIWKWSGVVLAMAVAAIVAVVIVNRQPVPTDATAPITAKAVPSPTMAPDAPKVAQPQIPKGTDHAPVMAGKKEPPANLAPAASEETMPLPSSRGDLPKMAPQNFDTVPGSRPPNR
ncbi:MAG: zf-HC2 domain-containing protein [Phaeospirillum sp.]|nr:zf-HC2 domain-containing protein [Phaeospirillum sp.]